jgi:hypothetical protein
MFLSNTAFNLRGLMHNCCLRPLEERPILDIRKQEGMEDAILTYFAGNRGSVSSK